MSAAPEPHISIAALREAIRRAAKETSTHRVAEEIGISQGGVRRLLAGSNPHPATIRKLTRWWVRVASAAAYLDEDTANAAIELLAGDYPEGQRDGVRAGLRDLLREAHRRAGTEPPDWLK
ncbi:MAG TPA: hypothetical protein VF006_09055 [Longimicrobium sp.]